MATITPSVAGGNWSATTAWTGGVVPTAADDVVFHAGAGNITVDGTSGSPSLCRSIDCATFLYTGILTIASAKFLAIGDGSGGSLTLYSGMTLTAVSGTINFVSTISSNTITTAGLALGGLNFNGSGGAWTNQDAMNCRGITLTAGSWNTNNFNLTCNGIVTSGSAFSTLTLGTTTVSLSATTGINFSTNSGMTVSGASSTILGANVGITFIGKTGGVTFGTINSQIGNGTLSPQNINCATWNLANTLSATQIGTISLTIGSEPVISGTMSTSGGAGNARIIFQSATVGSSATLSVGALSVNYVDFQDITAAGTANWNLSSIYSGNCGRNTGITFSSPQNNYYQTAVSDNSNTIAKWFLATNGSGGAGRVPLPQDTGYFDANSFTAGSITLTLNIVRPGTLDFTNTTNSPILSKIASTTIYGSLILSSGIGSITGTQGYTFSGPGSFNLKSGGLTWPAAPIILNAPGGTITQLDNFLSTSSLTITNGAWATGNNTLGLTTFTQSAAGASFTSGSALVTCSSTATWTGGNITIGSGGFQATTYTLSSSTTRNINLGTGTIKATGTGTVWDATTTTGLTFNASTSTIEISDTSASTKTFTGNTLTFNNIKVDGAASNGTVTFQNSWTANNLTFGANASIIWTKSTTYTFSSLTCNGTAGNLVIFATNTAGTAATLACANAIDVDYMNLKDSTASGNTPFYAGTHSTDSTGNTNWTFTTRPAGGANSLFFGFM